MKFPLATPPFTPLVLSATQCAAYQQLTTQLLHETIDEYDRFVRFQHRVLDPNEWKHFKTREHVSVFKQRDRAIVAEVSDAFPSSDDSSMTMSAIFQKRKTSLPKSSRSTPTGSLPKLLAVGTIVGNLDDVLYGIICPDDDAIKIKSEYIDDELADGRVLFPILTPTEQDPFQSLAVKWAVKNAVVWPRDAVFLEATGSFGLPNGRRIGYHVVHSVDLVECPELRHLGILRSEFSSCFLYRQRDDETTVDVYVKSRVDPAVSIQSSASALLGCWKSVWCAQNKKLAWMVRDASAVQAREQQFHDHGVTKMVVHTNTDGKRCCTICTRTLPKLRRVVACQLCRSAVCSRCRTARKLAYVRHTGDVIVVPTAFCKNCIMHGANTSAAEVARFEFVPGAIEKRDRKLRARSEDVRSVVQPRARRPRGGSLEAKTEPVGIVPSVALLETDADDESVHVETIEEWGREHSMEVDGHAQAVDHVALGPTEAPIPIPQVPTYTTSPVNPQQDMMRQIHALYVQVEQTYQLTKQRNETFQQF